MQVAGVGRKTLRSQKVRRGWTNRNNCKKRIRKLLSRKSLVLKVTRDAPIPVRVLSPNLRIAVPFQRIEEFRVGYADIPNEIVDIIGRKRLKIILTDQILC